LEEAKACFVEEETIYRRLGDQIGLARALNGFATLKAERGDYTSALEIFSEMVRIMRDYDEPYGLLSGLENSGHLCARTGSHDEALGLFEEPLGICSRLGNRSGRAAILSGISAVHIAQSEVDRAHETLGEALAIRR
jgi:tetratricopeptide (TPR) repeat protein